MWVKRRMNGPSGSCTGVISDGTGAAAGVGKGGLLRWKISGPAEVFFCSVRVERRPKPGESTVGETKWVCDIKLIANPGSVKMCGPRERAGARCIVQGDRRQSEQ